jgi:hypothetical protein
MDDLAVFFMSSGETIVYSGTDPSSFTLVGVFRLGAPVARNTSIKLGGDLVVATQDGYVSLLETLRTGRMGTRGVLSDQINQAATEAIIQTTGNYGWQGFYYPRGNMLMFNIPYATNKTYRQHVFNTDTGAPCRFKGINSRCWGLFNDKAYFGHSGIVYLFDDGYDDAGTQIDADAVCAPTYLNDKTANKQVTALQPVIGSDGPVALTVNVAGDFKLPTTAYGTVSFTGGSSDWDTATWDVDPWVSGGLITNEWKQSQAYGYTLRTRVRIRTQGQLVRWFSTNYMYNRAGLV